MNVGNDRPNVSLVVRACQHPQNSYTDLDFIVPRSLSKLDDIPKTYIYVENIQTGSEIIDYLVKLLESRGGPAVSAASSVVRPFNAAMSYEYRRAAMEAFRRGSIRIMVCTDAAGMVSFSLEGAARSHTQLDLRAVTFQILILLSNGMLPRSCQTLCSVREEQLVGPVVSVSPSSSWNPPYSPLFHCQTSRRLLQMRQNKTELRVRNLGGMRKEDRLSKWERGMAKRMVLGAAVPTSRTIMHLLENSRN